MPSVRFAARRGLALLQIDRPPTNAIDLALLDELVGVFEPFHWTLPGHRWSPEGRGPSQLGSTSRRFPTTGPPSARDGLRNETDVARRLRAELPWSRRGGRRDRRGCCSRCAPTIASPPPPGATASPREGRHPLSAGGDRRGASGACTHADGRLMLANRLIEADEAYGRSVRPGARTGAGPRPRTRDGEELAALDTTMYARTARAARGGGGGDVVGRRQRSAAGASGEGGVGGGGGVEEGGAGGVERWRRLARRARGYSSVTFASLSARAGAEGLRRRFGRPETVAWERLSHADPRSHGCSSAPAMQHSGGADVTAALHR